jgi:YegS/Rv2252/BmrU family lipid kinase
MTTKAILIYNPESGRGRPKQQALPDLLTRLKALGIEADPAATREPGHATELARAALQRKVPLIIAWGGDGTINEVARAMLGSETPLGILPGGTVNVFARETGIPFNLDKACRVLVEGKPRVIPVGMAGDRPFLLMAGIGIDAEVVHRLEVDARLKKRLGTFAFWLLGFRLLASYAFAPLKVLVDGKEVVGTGVVAGNVRCYGSGYVITPEARLEEPMLDVVVFQGQSGFAYLRYLLGVAGGFHVKFKDVVHFHAERLEVVATDGQHYQLDGESAGKLPVRLEIHPNALTVLLP